MLSESQSADDSDDSLRTLGEEYGVGKVVLLPWRCGALLLGVFYGVLVPVLLCLNY
jgi:hypothetical protein